MRTSLRAGFTLIEALLVVALIGVMAGIGIPIFQAFQNRNDLGVATATAAQTLRLAQSRARGMEGDGAWGVRVASGTITVFKGASFALRDTTLDDAYTISPALTVTGTTDYVFAKFTGEPGAAGTFTLTSPNNETRTLTINAKGMVAF